MENWGRVFEIRNVDLKPLKFLEMDKIRSEER